MAKRPTFKHFYTLTDLSSLLKKLLQKRPKFMYSRINTKAEALAKEAHKEIKRVVNRTTLKALNSPSYKKYLIAIISEDLKRITFYQNEDNSFFFVKHDNKKSYVSFGIHFYSQDIHATSKLRVPSLFRQHYASTLRSLLIQDGFNFPEDCDSQILCYTINLIK